MGSALVFPLSENGVSLRIVGTPFDREIIDACIRSGQNPKLSRPFPAGIDYYQFEDWKKVVPGSDFIIGGISSYGAEWFLDEVLMQLPADIPVITVVKGLRVNADGSLSTWPQYWEKKLCGAGISRKVYMLGGPGIAQDIISGEHTSVTISGDDAGILRMMKDCLQTGVLHVSMTYDVTGLEYAVAIKNAYALGPAIAIGLAHRKGTPVSVNAQASVFFQAAREMRRILRTVQAESECISMGLADLFVTVEGGRTRSFGILLGEGLSREEAQNRLKGVTLESISAVKSLYEGISVLAERGYVSPNGKVDMAEFPLITHLYQVLFEGKDADLPWDKFAFDIL